MPANVSEWEARHRDAAEKPFAEPASIVSEWLPMLPMGPALDLACGTGRHTRLLATRGQAVTGVDWSGAGLDVLEKHAKQTKLAVQRAAAEAAITPVARGIQIVQADLEKTTLPKHAFALIVCVLYLQRSLFRQIAQALQPGGVLLFETFTRAQLKYAGGPRDPAHLLDAGELRIAFPTLEPLFYRELDAGQGIASLVARRTR
jgi:tellurite methyltransferase